jgi:hypothetical protein
VDGRVLGYSLEVACKIPFTPPLRDFGLMNLNQGESGVEFFGRRTQGILSGFAPPLAIGKMALAAAENKNDKFLQKAP